MWVDFTNLCLFRPCIYRAMRQWGESHYIDSGGPEALLCLPHRDICRVVQLPNWNKLKDSLFSPRLSSAYHRLEQHQLSFYMPIRFVTYRSLDYKQHMDNIIG